MVINKINLGKLNTIETSGDIYYRKNTIFVLDIDGNFTYLQVCDIVIESDLPIKYQLRDISYYNRLDKMDEPNMVLGCIIRLADKTECVNANKESGYL